MTVCDYQGYEFGANYPDSVCVDGRLWDADSCDEPGGPLKHGGEKPCPNCNREAAIKALAEDLYAGGMSRKAADLKARKCIEKYIEGGEWFGTPVGQPKDGER